MSSASLPGRRTILGGTSTTDWQPIWRTILDCALTVGVIVLAFALIVVHRQERQLRSRLNNEAQSIRFVHDLVVLCSYDRHFCVGGETGSSPLVARILRGSGVSSNDPGKWNDR